MSLSMRSWTSWTAIEITEFCWRHLVNCEFREVSLTLCVYLLISLPRSLVSYVEYRLMWFKSFIGCRFTEARLLAVKNWICRQYLTAIFTFYVSSEWAVFGLPQCFTSPPTHYRLYGRRFLQVKRSNQQYQSTEGDATKEKENNENN